MHVSEYSMWQVPAVEAQMHAAAANERGGGERAAGLQTGLRPRKGNAEDGWPAAPTSTGGVLRGSPIGVAAPMSETALALSADELLAAGALGYVLSKSAGRPMWQVRFALADSRM